MRDLDLQLLELLDRERRHAHLGHDAKLLAEARRLRLITTERGILDDTRHVLVNLTADGRHVAEAAVSCIGRLIIGKIGKVYA